MISNVYNYYLSHYGRKTNSKYDTHTKTQLKDTYSKVARINSQTPTYKIDLSDAAQKYAIDLKENARELSNIASELSDLENGGMAFRKSAVSSDPDIVSAEYIGSSNSSEAAEHFEIQVSQLATRQINTGRYLQSDSKSIKPGNYSFDLNINNLTYEFQFGVEEDETVNDVQNKLSRLINRSNIGLKSSVTEDGNGRSAINIESDATGVTGIKPTIFTIRANNDTQSMHAESDAQSDQTAPMGNNEIIDILGIDRIVQYPSNAVFSINGEKRTSASNDITINKTYQLSLNQVSTKPVNISLKADADSILESINELVTGYNNLINVATNENNRHFEGNTRFQKEIAGIARTYKDQLSSNGLTVNSDGTLDINQSIISHAAGSDTLSGIFESLDSFKNSLQKKADDISLNPMNYVNNKIVAYKNPTRTITDPYNLSAYSGMMFNGYV